MPNAKDTTISKPRAILLLGNTGTGKTTQLLTLPGKKFAYLFDPNALLSLRGYDVEYEEFLPNIIKLDAIPSSEKGKAAAARDRVMGSSTADQYLEWERDFDKKYKSGYFDQFDIIAIDSATTLLDLIMERLLTLEGRQGEFPQQNDWGPQMVVFANIMRTLLSLNKTIFLTGHLMTDKDEMTQKIVQLPLFTGRLREKIPLLFSDVFVTTAATGSDGKVKYLVHTTPNNRETPIRTSARGLKPVEDVTIDWTKPLEGQGLGRLLASN